ncbi:ATPase [bacterium]|nr:MAG: ATPase [bacterium]
MTLSEPAAPKPPAAPETPRHATPAPATPPTPPWHSLPADAALERLGVDGGTGLTAAEAAARRRAHGANQITQRGTKHPLRIVWEQLTGTLVLILVAAAGVSAAIGDAKDAVAILAIVVLNAVLGFVQEHRAERAMAALKQLAAPMVRVRRDGEIATVAAVDVVPGDLVVLDAGSAVPADGRLVVAANLRVQEAILTGESEPVQKQTTALGAPDLPLGDRLNMAFMGTVISHGRGEMVVTATGMHTELGRVADLLQAVGELATPLQRRLAALGRWLAAVALALVVLVFGAGVAVGEDAGLMLMTAISMAVAVVPEGLPAVVTITLALGAQRMLRRRALIRTLPAVETLGSVTVICSDKTGTLTENRMTVTVLDLADQRLDVTEAFKHGEPVFLPGAASAAPLDDRPDLVLLLAGGALCNDAALRPSGTVDGTYHAVGDPTEGALAVAAARFGVWKPDLDRRLPRVAEAPFDSERKRMTTVHAVSGSAGDVGDSRTDTAGMVARLPREAPYMAFTKGAVDGLLDVARHVWTQGHRSPLDAAWRARILAANADLAAKGMRVLGVAFRPLDAPPATSDPDAVEADLTFVGLVGMIDPPRPEVKDAIATCTAAGIRTVMITGDHPLTAREIARSLGIGGDRVVTGSELAAMSAADLEAVADTASVFARVSPEHKLDIVAALQRRGHVVAMTGDGVNDAPALKRADIGVAMGITGTDVAKEASEMVLLDDNFTTIVAAVEEGRAIYDNVRKFIQYSLAGNLGKILVVVLGPLAGLPLPFTPFQILWMNLVTDGVLGLGMSVEPAEAGAMRRPPHRPDESVFARGLAVNIGWVGALIGALGLGVMLAAWRAEMPEWQTMGLTTVIFAQAFQALAFRSASEPLWRIGLRSNPALLAAVLVIVVLQMAVVYAPFLHGWFGTRPLSPGQLVATLAVGSVVLWAAEIHKAWRHGRA